MYSRVVRFVFLVLILAIAVPVVVNAGGPPCSKWFGKVPHFCALNNLYTPDGVYTGRGSYGPMKWAYKLTVRTVGEKTKKKRKVAGKGCYRPVRWCR